MKSLSYCIISIFILSFLLGCQVQSLGNSNESTKEKNTLSESPQHMIDGKWSIQKIMTYSRITTIDKDTANQLVGSSIQISSNFIQTDPSVVKSILSSDDKETTPKLSDPSYEFTLVDDQKQAKSMSPSSDQLGFKEDKTYRVDIYKDKQFEDQWSLGIFLFEPSTPDRIVLSTNGVYYELKRS